MKNVKFVVIKDGKIVRHGVCQEVNVYLQARDGEISEIYNESVHVFEADKPMEVPAKKAKERDLYSLVPLLMESIVDESKKQELIDAINGILK